MVSEQVSYGVRTVEVGADRAGQRLDNFIARHLPGLPKSAVYRLIRTGQVRINGARARPSQRLEPGDAVRIPPARVNSRGRAAVPEPVLRQLAAAVIDEDDDFLVLDKPAGLAVHGGSGVKWGVIDAVRQLRQEDDIELVHRLDRETSGVLLLAKNARVMRSLHAQFRHNEPTKQYLCLMDGRLREDKVVVEAPLRKQVRSGERFMIAGHGGKPALTEFWLLQDYSGFSFTEARPFTGRTHQIRAHAVHLGLPLAGDARYAPPEAVSRWQERGLNRLFLHAHALTVRDASGRQRQWTSALPADLRGVLDALRP
jgi:23S rRNA pseudouridine955/2504/2580 synthase